MAGSKYHHKCHRISLVISPARPGKDDTYSRDHSSLAGDSFRSLFHLLRFISSDVRKPRRWNSPTSWTLSAGNSRYALLPAVTFAAAIFTPFAFSSSFSKLSVSKFFILIAWFERMVMLCYFNLSIFNEESILSQIVFNFYSKSHQEKSLGLFLPSRIFRINFKIFEGFFSI